jgi:CubicO group peptidase (beta-lactamase class C family)
MMLNGGRLGNERILSRPSVELMTADQITPEQKLGSEIFFGDNRGWGFGMSVFTKRDDLSSVPGRFGWEGGYGTSWYSDPSEQLTGILLTQRMMDSPQPPRGGMLVLLCCFGSDSMGPGSADAPRPNG